MSFHQGLMIENNEPKFMIFRESKKENGVTMNVYIFRMKNGNFRCCAFDKNGNYEERWTLKCLYSNDDEYRLERKFIYFNKKRNVFLEVDLESQSTKEWVFTMSWKEIENNYILKQQADYLWANKS